MTSIAHRRAQKLTGQLLDAPISISSLRASATASMYAKGVLAGQVVIVTGSGQGIGEAAAHLFANEGAHVVVTDIDAKKSDAVAAAIRSAGGSAISVPGDITDKEFPDRIVKATVDKFGKINHLINNAGYTWDGLLHKTTDEQWDAMLRVHNTAPFRLIRAAAPYFRDGQKDDEKAGRKPEDRSIVNVSSTSGLHGNFGQANYATAKAGIVGLTKTIAKEWGQYGVRANSLAFGWIDTRLTQDKGKGAFMQVGDKKIALGIPGAEKRTASPQAAAAATAGIPLRRTGRVEDAAGALLMLISPHASYVTGHTLECTGGVGI